MARRVVGNSATPSRPPIGSSAAATFTSRCVSTPPVTGRVASTVVIAIPSLSFGKGWHAPPNACGAGAIVLFAQGDPPHSRFDSCHDTLACRSTDRSEDRLTVSRFSSQTSNPKQTDGIHSPRHRGGWSAHQPFHTPCRIGRVNWAELMTSLHLKCHDVGASGCGAPASARGWRMRRPGISKGFALSVILVGGLFAPVERSGAAGAATLSVSPRQGPAPSSFGIDGAGFKPFEPVTLHIFSASEVRRELANAEGDFRSAFYIVQHEYPGGNHEVWAVGSYSGRRAETTFRLLPTVESEANVGMVGDRESGGLREFSAQERVLVTLWRNGRVESELSTFAMGDHGSGPFRWKVPELPGGKYELEAAGSRERPGSHGAVPH